jgi:ParB family chromosome partitioning protein
MRAGTQLVHAFIRAEDTADPLDRLNDILTLRLTDPIEEAQAYDEALTRLQVGQRELSAMIGVPQPHISKRLKLLRLPQHVREAVRTRQLPIEHALHLAG